MNDTTPLPVSPAEPGADRPRRSVRPVLIGTGAALTVLTLGVGGFALADTLRSGADDRIVITSGTASPSPTRSSIDDDLTVTDAEYAAVTAAALAAVGGGTVTEVDRGDSVGDPAWKVEILLANGDEAEVRLDENLNVIRVELDSNHGDESDDTGMDDDGTDDQGTGDTGSDVVDDHGGDDSGIDDSGHHGGDDSGDDSGHGGDDSGSDDHGSGGHGSDD